jgi:hypothetical protein
MAHHDVGAGNWVCSRESDESASARPMHPPQIPDPRSRIQSRRDSVAGLLSQDPNEGPLLFSPHSASIARCHLCDASMPFYQRPVPLARSKDVALIAVTAEQRGKNRKYLQSDSIFPAKTFRRTTSQGHNRRLKSILRWHPIYSVDYEELYITLICSKH